MTTVNADLFRMTALFTSTEETRYYLQGVCIEKHPDLPGAILVATDGHRLFVAHDENADVTHEGQMIVRLDKPALIATKLGRVEKTNRLVQFADSKAPAYVMSGDRAVAMSHDWLIDGTFPDWRRALPLASEPSPITVASHLLKDFIKVAADLDSPSNAIRIETCGEGAAMRILFTVPYIMGVLMPMRWKAHTGVPAFLPHPELEPVAEAAE